MKKNSTFFKKKFLIVRFLMLPWSMFFMLQFTVAYSLHNSNFQDDTREISGIITDGSTGEPLPGVSILIKGTTNGTVSDAEGNFKLKVSNGNILVISFVGYLSKELEIGDQTFIEFQLITDITQLDEVVVIGYGSQKRKLSSNATVHVSEKDIEDRNSIRIEQSIQGLTPGVLVTANTGQPGENPKVRIRGVGTIGDPNPLFMVDGIPTNDIRYLSPTDVESVDVLKDAASAAIYGTRAANGVILITTKKGKTGRNQLRYDTYYGIQNVAKKVDLLNGREYMMLMNEASINGGNDSIYSENEINSFGDGTDWQDYLFIKNAQTYSHTLSYSGGNEISNFSSSLSYLKQDGIAGEPGKSNYERISARINSEHKVYKDIIKLGENMVYSHSNKRGIGIGNVFGGSNIVRSFLNATPISQVYDTSYSDGFARSSVNNLKDANPVALMHFFDNSWAKEDRIFGNVFTEINFFKGFKYVSSYGIDLSYYYNNTYDPVYVILPLVIERTNSRASQTMGLNFTYNFENYITFNKTFKKNNLTLLIGNTINKFTNFEVRGTKEDLIIEDLNFALLDNGTNDATQTTNGTKLERTLLSYYGRLNYNYAEKYLLAASYRVDGSSKFGPENRYGKFPSFSAGWIVTEENYMRNSNWLNYLKIRSSWGINGNDKIGDYQFGALITSEEAKAYYFGKDIKYIGSSPVRIHNPKLKWERSEQFDFGFDMNFMDHFSFTFDIYRKTTRDWLIVAPVADIAGNTAPTINGGTVRNQGIEVMIGYHNNLGGFNYSLDGNIAYNQNKVTEINNPEGVVHSDRHVIYNQSPVDVYRAEEGYPIGYFYGYEMLGIFQNQQDIQNYYMIKENGDTVRIQNTAKPGDIKYADRNKNGLIDSKDQTMIGDPNPDITFGASLSAQFKGFDLSIFLQGVAGNQILYGFRNYDLPISNYSSEALDRWHGEGTSNTYPRLTLSNSVNFQRISSLFIKNGSYLKIRNVNLGYDFKTSLLKKLPIQKFRLYFSAQNLFTFSKYPGYDPEVGYGDYDANRYQNFSTGIDIGYYPQPRTYLIGLNVEF